MKAREHTHGRAESDCLPLIQSNAILNEQQVFLWQKLGPIGCGQFNGVWIHSRSLLAFLTSEDEVETSKQDVAKHSHLSMS